MIGLTTNTPGRNVSLKILGGLTLLAIWTLSIQTLQAGSATWAADPGSGDWNNSANWVPVTIPNNPADDATFGASTQTNISILTSVEVSGITFSADAGDYVITADPSAEYASLLVSGPGITNDSGRVQNFVAGTTTEFNLAEIAFGNSATAGSGTQITNLGGTSAGHTYFGAAATAGSATIINGTGVAPDGQGGSTLFGQTSSADAATIINDAGSGIGGNTLFLNNSSAGNSTITNHGATASGQFGAAETRFIESSSASDATLIANGGSNGGNGGSIQLSENSTGGRARVEIYGNGRLDLRGHYSPNVTIGSLAGSGTVFLGIQILTVGSNNTSTTFSGMIRGGDEGGITGGLTKVGTGTLTLSGTGSFASLVTINAGRLEMTGSLLYAPTNVNEGGTLTGSGTVGGVFVNRLGLVAPGEQRTLHTGGYEQYPGGVLRIEVAGTDPGASDHLEIESVARLDGTLEVRFVNGFLPASGQVFKIFTAGFGLNGSFARIIFPDLRSGFQFQPEFVNDAYQITALNDGVASTGFLNISTRMRVGTGDNALIGGFIVTGNAPKRVILRAIGPSLPGGGRLADPTLELHGPSGEIIALNDNWMESAQAQEIIESGVAPGDDHEAAIVSTLAPGTYTAIMRGSNNTTGIGIVEVYDLTQGASAKLDNISTRGFVESGDNVMIAGFIADNQATHVMVRALGPSLAQSGVVAALADPTLTLHDAQGATIAFNNDWRDADQVTLAATGIPPTNDRESAIVATLAPGGYTAIVRGLNDTIGVGLVEVYRLN